MSAEAQVPHGPIGVGDRVMVCPLSRNISDLDGEWGTVEHVIPEGEPYLGGALYVRMDCDGRLFGCGPEAITGHVPSPGGTS